MTVSKAKRACVVDKRVGVGASASDMGGNYSSHKTYDTECVRDLLKK